MTDFITILPGDCRAVLAGMPDKSVHCVVTSPPYFGLRDYGDPNQIGLEPSPQEYVSEMVAVFREIRRVLRDDGTVWLNLGDSYSHGGCGARDPERWPKQSRNDQMPVHAKKKTGLKPKDLIGIPWRVAFALQDDGWYLRQDIIWAKSNPMPESVTDRCTKSHEYIFLLSKSSKYYFDSKAIQEPAVRPNDTQTFGGKKAENSEIKEGDPRYRAGSEQWGRTATSGETRNKRSVWNVAVNPFREAHFATYPVDLVMPCILAGAPEGGVVLDPFFGAGTTGIAARAAGRRCIGIELNPEYIEIARRRLFENYQENLFNHAIKKEVE